MTGHRMPSCKLPLKCQQFTWYPEGPLEVPREFQRSHKCRKLNTLTRGKAANLRADQHLLSSLCLPAHLLVLCFGGEKITGSQKRTCSKKPEAARYWITPHRSIYSISCRRSRTERQLALQLPHICRRPAQLLGLPGFQEPASSSFTGNRGGGEASNAGR